VAVRTSFLVVSRSMIFCRPVPAASRKGLGQVSHSPWLQDRTTAGRRQADGSQMAGGVPHAEPWLVISALG
jgi:hypothetical protein